MKPTILLINFQDQQKLRKLKMALLPFKLRIKTIEPQDYSQPIGYLAGVKEISQVQIPSALIPQEQMEKEMLILAGITGNLFDQVLYTLRKAGTPVDYKAVLTEHNQNWNCMQLYKELEKEQFLPPSTQIFRVVPSGSEWMKATGTSIKRSQRNPLCRAKRRGFPYARLPAETSISTLGFVNSEHLQATRVKQGIRET